MTNDNTNTNRNASINSAISGCGVKPNLKSRPAPLSDLINRYSAKDMFCFSGNSFEAATIIDKVQSGGRFAKEEYYLLVEEVQECLVDQIRPMTFHQAVSTTGAYRLYPQKLPLLNGDTNSWFESMEPIVEAALDDWITVKSNMQTSEYEYSVSRTKRPLPNDWPDFDEQLETAFKGKVIDSLDHPVLKRLGIDITNEIDFDDDCLDEL
ncbi:hypothetical protein [Neptunomonas qingdaonensis]|uniref:Uncharacterized protein n=1 Tax=Neptunomonas qingdaonensis TaxID=1045558 RepID=A0A1I2MWW1_9GAMM|nr:hypothetical protein [Neptunomonas qingdaonensis]SFF95962.1 hypothetical protein SAMN05216175_102148 [Neptunomonas qingdaonensis]